MNIQEIIKCLPHRYPFLMVDRVLSIELGKSLQAIKNVTSNEAYFTGHFPQRMVMPGVLILEALAQACAILAMNSFPDQKDDDSLFLFAGIDNARFKRVVEPGDQLLLDVTMTSTKHSVLKCHTIASVNGEVACTADLMSVKRKIA